MDNKRQAKIDHLRRLLRDMGKVMIAFSGGVDSTFLLKVAKEELGVNAIAVVAISPFFPAWEKREAEDLAKALGVPYRMVVVDEMEIQDFAHNPPDRCYFCKRIIFTKLLALAKKEGIDFLCDGTNLDDLNDYRPGMAALRELGIRSPLKETQLTKAEIRHWSKELGLPTWNKPAFACLATRLPYGIRITQKKLKQIDQGEEILRGLGLKQFRLRHHNEVARLEIAPGEFPLVLEHSQQIVQELKNLGYTYVTLDLEGYRSGSMNETLNIIDPLK